MQASVNCSESRILELPPSISSSCDSVEVRSQSSVVVIGANGSVKTRFGSWIELHSPERYLVHRIAAQKSLYIPDYLSTSSWNAATNLLRYGYHQENLNDQEITNYKIGHKWQSKPNTALQNDYDKLLTFLFTEEYEKSTKFRQQCQTTERQETPPETHLDIIKRIWESVLPHRELITDKAEKIEARPKSGGNSYHGAEMSAGFKTFNAKAIGEEKLKESLDQMVSTINLPCLYQETSKKIDRILENQDYSEALRLYPNKGLLPQVSSLFGFEHNQVVDHIKRLIRQKEKEKIIRALRNSLPELPTINQDEDMSKN